MDGPTFDIKGPLDSDSLVDLETAIGALKRARVPTFENLPPAPPLQDVQPPQQQDPNLVALQQQLQQVPQLSQYKPSIWRRLASVPVGLQGGPEAQEAYKQLPYRRAMQDWTTRLGAQEKALGLPGEMALTRAKAEEAQESARLYRFQATPEYQKLTKGWLPQTEAEKLREIEAMHPARPLNLQQELVRLQDSISDPTTPPEIKQASQDEFNALQGIKPTTKPSEEQRKEDTYLRAKYGVDYEHATPKQREEATEKVSERGKTVIPAGEVYGRTEAAITNIESKLSTKLETQEDYTNRLNRMLMALNMKNVSLDPVIAPEFLASMVGRGVGLRMNDAEINRIFGGLQGWDLVQRDINKWLLGDHTTPYMIPENMRDAFRQAGMTVLNRASAEAELVEDYKDKIADAKNPATAWKLESQLRKKIRELDKQDFSPKKVIKPGELVP
jgi:hypothetical protein